MASLTRLRDFIAALGRELAHDADEPARLAAVRTQLAHLIAHDDWLPDELAQPYAWGPDGRLVASAELQHLHPGDIEAASPRLGDIHQVSNAFADRVSISIHVYGANIGKLRRSVYGEDGSRKPFVSGYLNA